MAQEGTPCGGQLRAGAAAQWVDQQPAAAKGLEFRLWFLVAGCSESDLSLLNILLMCRRHTLTHHLPPRLLMTVLLGKRTHMQNYINFTANDK